MRVHNFGAGPCTLPLPVLEEVQRELLEYAGTGMSLVELSHRSAAYQSVHDEALALVRAVAEVPPEFEVLFVQGGATLQFGMVPLNLLAEGGRAGFVVTGSWAKKALADGRAAGDAYVAWDGAGVEFVRGPAPDEIRLEEGTRYLHVTTNETIGGLRIVDMPDVPVPMVADVSSELLARPIDWPRFDVVYGGIQKNLGPAGLALVFVRRSVVEESPDRLPAYLRYAWHAGGRSLANTPAMFQIYVMGKVLRRLQERGGVSGLERESAAKSALLYAVIDESDGFYRSSVEPASRSHMNVVFRLPSEEAETAFLEEAETAGLVALKGHRSVGGCRASLYAAMEIEGVQRLADFMREFQAGR